MINWLHAVTHRPEQGWDPVPAEHAVHYAQGQWEVLDEAPLQELEDWLGGFAGKDVLDLGGGPGQFTVAMARRGARVTWHDVSANYREIVRARNPGYAIRDSLGYLEDAIRLGESAFDLVFNRICFNYSRSDRHFVQMIWKLLKPGGVGYVDTNNALFHFDELALGARLRTWLNTGTGWKIGHPFPPHGRLARLVLALPTERVVVDYSRATNDRIIFRKAR
ncbi:MAG TPA: methyltransferase domain-containing protein [Steroidobacteraceae bacterium]|jgi:2-polyprenyl-3-methyl-5-hydroxy-6-metoxy-1,4-benzoquinol methylase|nr:methyltransferase domain-containing protein [Steroidobacteraceae bacterium]